MNRWKGTLLLVLGAAVAVSATAGCRPQLAPTEDGILYYVRNARLHGEVRRLWPAGQAYIDAVLKSDAKLRDALAPLLQLREPESLWSTDDPRWQDPEEVGAQVSEMQTLTDEGSAKRRTALSALREAVEAVPASLNLSEDAEAAFADRVWGVLALADARARVELREAIPALEETLRARLDLYRMVQGAAGSPDTKGTEAGGPDRASHPAIERPHGDIEAALRENQASFIAHAASVLAEQAAAAPDRFAREHRNAERAYYRKGLEKIPKNLQNLIERTKKRLAGEESSSARKYLEQRVERLTAKLEGLRTRVELILETASPGDAEPQSDGA